MAFLDKLFSGGASSLIDSVGNAIDKLTTTKEEKMTLDLEMKKADQQFQIDMQKLSNEQQQQVFQDVSAARTMATAIQTSPTATKLAKNTAPFMALGTTILTFSLFFALIFFPEEFEKNGKKEIVLYILGVLSAIVTQIFSFYFGSSQGSADKSRTIENMHNSSLTTP